MGQEECNPKEPRTLPRIPLSLSLSHITVLGHRFVWYSKVHPRTGHEGPDGEYKYSSTLSLTSALDGVGGQHHAPANLPPGKTRYVLYRRLGGPTGPDWTVVENLAPIGIRSPDRPVRSQSLYRLSYRGPFLCGRWVNVPDVQTSGRIHVNFTGKRDYKASVNYTGTKFKRTQILQRSKKPPQNSWRHKGDTNQVPY